MIVAGLALALGVLPAAAGVTGRDNRTPVAVMQAGDAQSRALAALARSVGVVSCNNGRYGAATLVGPRTIVSVAHIFIGLKTDGSVECRFYPEASREGGYAVIRLVGMKMGANRITGVNICSNGRDWAVAQLETPVAGRVPVPLASMTPRPGAALAPLSFMAAKGGAIGRCTLRDHVGPCRETGVPLLFTDCLSEQGDSGGPVFVEEGGAWKLGAITRGASRDAGPVYDKARIYHMAIPVSGPLLRAIQDMK